MTFDMLHDVLQLSLPSLYRFNRFDFFCRLLSAACCKYAPTVDLQTDVEPSNDCAEY